MYWGEYKRLPESTVELILLITEGGTCLYDAKVYLYRFAGTYKKIGTFKKAIAEDEGLADTVQKYRLWLIEEKKKKKKKKYKKVQAVVD